MNKDSKADAGLEAYAVRNEVVQCMPKVFVDLYEVLVSLGLGPGLGVSMFEHPKADTGVVERMTAKSTNKEGPKAEWLCSCGMWTKDSSSFCDDGDCQRARESGCKRRLAEGVKVVVGVVVPVGQPKRVRVDTSETVTRGGSKGAAGGKREAARRQAVIGSEYALALRDRLDRSIRRVVREVLKDVGMAAVYRPGSGAALIVEHVGTVEEAIRWRRCSKVGICGRILDETWLYCVACGAPSMEA